MRANVSRTDCPNSNCGVATVSKRKIWAVFGRDRMIHYAFLVTLCGLLLFSLFIAGFGGSIGLPSSIVATAMASGFVSAGIIIIVYGTYVRRVGIQIYRYRCSKCSYRWMQFDFGPGIAQRLTWKFEEELLRHRKRGNRRKLRNTLLALASCELYQNDYERAARLLEVIKGR